MSDLRDRSRAQPEISERRAGAVWGALVGDSLALGAHWIYDQEELAGKFGRVTELREPGDDSYHPTKEAGEQTHYGDQAITLMRSIAVRKGFDVSGFAQDWRRMWAGYGDYFDKATKATLKLLEEGKYGAAAASPSDELGGAARIGPLLAWMAGAPVESAVAAARAQTALTHGAPIALDSAEYLARVVFALFDGVALGEALRQAGAGNYAELDLGAIWKRLEELRSQPLLTAADELGLSCPASKAMPTLLLLLERCGNSFEQANIENVMAGGDNAARGLALGMILGAAHGREAIPARWAQALRAGAEVGTFLRKLPPR